MKPQSRIVLVAVVAATAIVSAAGAWLLVALGATAHPIRDRFPARPLSARERVGLELDVLRHSRQTLRFFENHAFLLYSAPQATKRIAWRVVLYHRASSRWAGRELREARADVVPPIAHRALWQCIHEREADWHGTDNATHVTYFGGLQMGDWFMRTYGGRLLAARGTADHWSAEEQMRVAEDAYRREGYSLSWLHSQWPETSPPCSEYA